MKKGKVKEAFLIEKTNKLFLITNYNNKTTLEVLDNTKDEEVTNQICVFLGEKSYNLEQVNFIKWNELTKEEKTKYINLEKKAELDKINILKSQENFFLVTSIVFSIILIVTFLYGIYMITNLHTTIDTFIGVIATLVIPSVMATGIYLHTAMFKECSKELNKIRVNKFKINLINQLSNKEG